MRTQLKLDVESVEYHRNGISGEGFHIVLFRYLDEDRGTDAFDQYRVRSMIGIVFGIDENEDPPGNPRTAVLDRDLLAQGDVGFGRNSWRGDHFHDQLVAAIQDQEQNRPL